MVDEACFLEATMMAVLDSASTSSAMLMLFVLVNPRDADSLTAVAVASPCCLDSLAVAREEIVRRCLLVSSTPKEEYIEVEFDLRASKLA